MPGAVVDIRNMEATTQTWLWKLKASRLSAE